MRVHRFHLQDLSAGRCTVRGPEAGHLIQVLRVGPGAKVRAFDGRGLEADGTVVGVEQESLEVELGPPVPSEVEADLAIVVAPALLKGDKLSDVVRQGTEIGAAAFRPFISRRSDVPQLSPNKLVRLRRVAQEAAKQCGRAVVPSVDEAVHLESLQWTGTALFAQPGSPLTLAQAIPPDVQELMLITGSEGGFDQREVSWLQENGAVGVRLGNRILRAETAPVAMLAAILLPEAR